MKKNVLMGLLSLLMLAVCTVGNAQTPVKRYGQLQVRGSQYNTYLYHHFEVHILKYVIHSYPQRLWITCGKRVENKYVIHSIWIAGNGVGDIHWFITAIHTRFPRFSTDKSYKLINYAP